MGLMQAGIRDFALDRDFSLKAKDVLLILSSWFRAS